MIDPAHSAVTHKYGPYYFLKEKLSQCVVAVRVLNKGWGNPDPNTPDHASLGESGPITFSQLNLPELIVEKGHRRGKTMYIAQRTLEERPDENVSNHHHPPSYIPF